MERLAQRHHQGFRNESRHHGMTCKFQLHGHECRLLKPSTYMNRSGQSVSSLANYFRIPPEAILVAHDELDLPPGEVRLKTGGGHAGQPQKRSPVHIFFLGYYMFIAHYMLLIPVFLRRRL